MRSPEPRLDGEARQALVAVARRSIAHGLEHGAPLRVDPAAHPPLLCEPRASFVTLQRAGALRGCIGALEPSGSLVAGVAKNAWSAAFRDPRFAPLTRAEAPDLALHISVLSPLEPLPVDSRDALLAALRPERDGLVLRQETRRATFLPSVWSKLREPEAFVAELERKAGLAPGAWQRGVECLRYSVEEWSG